MISESLKNSEIILRGGSVLNNLSTIPGLVDAHAGDSGPQEVSVFERFRDIDLISMFIVAFA